MASGNRLMELEIKGKREVIAAFDGVLLEIKEAKDGLNNLLKNKVKPEATQRLTGETEIIVSGGLDGNSTLRVMSENKSVDRNIIVDAEKKLVQYTREVKEGIVETWSKT